MKIMSGMRAVVKTSVCGATACASGALFVSSGIVTAGILAASLPKWAAILAKPSFFDVVGHMAKEDAASKLPLLMTLGAAGAFVCLTSYKVMKMASHALAQRTQHQE